MLVKRQICEQITYTYNKCLLIVKFPIIWIEESNSFNLNPGGRVIIWGAFKKYLKCPQPHLRPSQNPEGPAHSKKICIAPEEILMYSQSWKQLV